MSLPPPVLYAIEAINQHGAMREQPCLRRICRCHPWVAGVMTRSHTDTKGRRPMLDPITMLFLVL